MGPKPTALPRLVRPSDPMAPNGGFYTVCELIGYGGHPRVACPIAAYRDPAIAMHALQNAASWCAGFFSTYVLIDPFGQTVGKYSMTTMAPKGPGWHQAPSLRYPQMRSGAFDQAGINIDEVLDRGRFEQVSEEQQQIVALVAEAERAERRRQREATSFDRHGALPVRLRKRAA